MEDIGNDKKERIALQENIRDICRRSQKGDEPELVQTVQKQLAQSQGKDGDTFMDKQETRPEPFKEPRRVKPQKFLSSKGSDNGPELPKQFKVGQAFGGGDCFFDSVAKGLKSLKPELDVSVKSLREVCKEFAQRQLDINESWLKQSLKTEVEPIHEYIPRIEFTVHDIAQNSGQVSVLGLSAPIQGRSEVEGRIISEKYNVKLHIIEKHVAETKVVWLNQIIDSEGSRSVDYIDYSEGNTIHILNNGKTHFQPILLAYKIQESDGRNLKKQGINFKSKNNNVLLTNKHEQDAPDSNSEGGQLGNCDKKNERSRRKMYLPYSDKLPLDMDLKLSNRNFKSVIESDLIAIQNSELNSVEKLNFCNRPAFLDEYLLVQFASRVYKEGKNSKELSDKIMPNGWKLLTTACNQHVTNHYFGAAYWNPQQQQIVIAHQGTDPSSIGALWTDLRGILYNNYVSQMSSAVTFANEITTVLDELNRKPNVNLQLSITGHSLGGWLAQITTFTTKYFALESFAGGLFFVRRENMGHHAHAVGFDSPGSKNMLEKMTSDFDLRHYKDDNSLSPSSLDITSYLSLPNLINTCCPHLGTMYQIFIEDLPSDRSSWDFGKYTKETHSIERIEKALDPKKGTEKKEVIDWPLVKKRITRRALDILMNIGYKILKAARKIIFNERECTQLLKCNEYEFFHKLAKDVGHYNPEPDDKERYCVVRYQVQFTDKSKCNTSIFTQPELEFLFSYQYLRKHSNFLRLENLFSPLGSEAIETIEVLKSFEIKEKEKVIRSSSEEQLVRLISYVKNMLYFFPEISCKIEDMQMKVHIWFDVRESLQSFIGRQEELDQIATAINQRTVVVSGLGGIGKSELAIKYAHEYCKDHEGNVIWINAETLDTARISFLRLLKELRIKTTDQDGHEKSVELMAKEVFEYLAGKASLFIFDNAEIYSVIKDFLPSRFKGYHILITSRNRELFNELAYGKVERLNLDILPENETIEFVKNVLNINDMQQDEKIKELVRTLGHLPLALQHAVAYIKESGYIENIGRYVGLYKKSELEIQSFLNHKGLSTYDKTIFFTFKTAIDNIKQKENTNLAVEILNSIAYFASDNIPKEIFLRFVQDSVEESDVSMRIFRANGMVTQAINLLNQFSLINLKEDQVNIHRLVQEVIRLEMRKEEEQGKTLEEKVLAKILGLLKEHMINRDEVDNYMSHIISVWNYARKYDHLIEDYIVNNISRREAYTTYFHVITKSSSCEVVEAILNKIDNTRIDEVINVKDKERRTSLHNAAETGDEQIVRILITKGAKVNARKKHEWTPLHLAAKNGHLKSVTVLLENQANVNAKTGFKFTPLHLAARDGHSEVASVLLKAEADIHAETKSKFTPLHIAAENNQLEVLKVLLKAKVNINAQTLYKFTPLHLAAKKGYLEVVITLLGKGANIDAFNNGKFTALHLAAQNGHLEIVNTLLDKKASINAQTTNGNTALHFAAENNHLKIVEALFLKDVKINIVNKEGKAALELAEESGNSEVEDYIKQQILNRRPGTPSISD